MSKKLLFSSKNAIVFNMLMCFVIIYLASIYNINQLYQSIDGAYTMEMVRQQFEWKLYSFLGFKNNLFQALSENVYLPLNTAMIPTYVVSAWFFNGKINIPLSYGLFALELFLVMYFVGRYFKFSKANSIISAWALIALAFPLIGRPKIYGILYLIPHISTSIAETLILMMVMSCVTKRHILRSVLMICLTYVIAMHMFIAYPTFIIQSGIFLFLYAIFLVFRGDKAENTFVAACFGLVASALIFSGIINYFVGLFGYTAATFYRAEMITPRTWRTLSIAADYEIFGYSGMILVFLGTIGAIRVAFSKIAVKRTLALFTLSYELIFFISGAAMIQFQLLSGYFPDNIYLEYVLWPLYSYYSVTLLLEISSMLYKHISSDSQNVNRLAINVLYMVPIFISFMLLIEGIAYTRLPRDFPYPSSSNSIFSILRKNLSVEPGSEFNGRAASFFGQNLINSSWYDINHIFFKVDYILLTFSYYNIPTLFEYNQLLDPVYYKFVNYFLSYPNDKRIRNVLDTRKVNIKIMKMLGVKYFIADAKMRGDYKLRAYESNPDAYLYELSDVNIGQYSPVTVINKYSASDILKTIAMNDFDPAKQVITQFTHNSQLVPILKSSLSFDVNGVVHVKAESEGESILVMPLEFSNCLEVNSSDKTIKLFRANMLLLGIAFKDKLDLDISYFTGPFHNSKCRLQDIADARDLGL